MAQSLLIAAADWATFKGDVQRSGHVRQAVDVSRLELNWQHRLPTAIVSSPVVATPSLDDVRIYLGSSQPGYILANDKDSGDLHRTAGV